jgi:hypothetical protein
LCKQFAAFIAARRPNCDVTGADDERFDREADARGDTRRALELIYDAVECFEGA